MLRNMYGLTPSLPSRPTLARSFRLSRAEADCRKDSLDRTQPREADGKKPQRVFAIPANL